MSDFQEVNPILLKRGGTSRYFLKYITKSGEKALYSKGLPSEIVRELSDNDIVDYKFTFFTEKERLQGGFNSFNLRIKNKQNGIIF